MVKRKKRQKNSGNDVPSKILIVTAILNLINALLNLIQRLVEWLIE